MRIQRVRRRSVGWVATAVLGVLVLLSFGGSMVYRTVYEWNAHRLSAGRARASAVRPSEVVERPLLASEPHLSRPAAETAEAAAMPMPESQPAASPASSETKDPEMDQPFIDARQERRDPVWAREMEWKVRDAADALRNKKVTLQSVQCASIRCTVEGTIGAGGGDLQEVVTAISKVGLSRGRIKLDRGGDGTTRFSAVIARSGYNVHGLPKEGVAMKSL